MAAPGRLGPDPVTVEPQQAKCCSELRLGDVGSGRGIARSDFFGGKNHLDGVACPFLWAVQKHVDAGSVTMDKTYLCRSRTFSTARIILSQETGCKVCAVSWSFARTVQR
jgi:hypothetical protein